MTRGHASCYHVGYSLTCAEYDDLRRIAGGRCMICKEATARPIIEHDHSLGTWAVRGLVCHGCNQHLKVVDAGKVSPSPIVTAYLAEAWHLRQASSATKRARVRPRTTCPTCGRDCAAKPDGSPWRHWSRLPGRHDVICPGAQLPERPAADGEA